MTIQATHRQRVLSAMERRRLTPAEVARMAGVVPRTVQRFVEGKTFSLQTYDLLAAALRLEGPVADPSLDSGVGTCVKVLAVQHKGPVSGWKQAADLLGMSRWTLWSHRRQHGDRTVTPRWRDADALWRWYDRMVGKEVG